MNCELWGSCEFYTFVNDEKDIDINLFHSCSLHEPGCKIFRAAVEAIT